MLIEQPPLIYRWFFQGAIWRINKTERAVYLTFDDGPIPEMTEWILDLLDKYNIKATFFCVGDNIRKYPELFEMIKKRGHVTGNHTFHHLQGIKTRTKNYIRDTEEAARLTRSNLFRPPHGHVRFRQFIKLKREFKVIMWDVVTRDYSWRLNAEQVFRIVKKYTRNGSIIVFHDSIKSEPRIKKALPESIEWLLKEGYVFKKIDL